VRKGNKKVRDLLGAMFPEGCTVDYEDIVTLLTETKHLCNNYGLQFEDALADADARFEKEVNASDADKTHTLMVVMRGAGRTANEVWKRFDKSPDKLLFLDTIVRDGAHIPFDVKKGDVVVIDE